VAVWKGHTPRKGMSQRREGTGVVARCAKPGQEPVSSPVHAFSNV